MNKIEILILYKLKMNTTWNRIKIEEKEYFWDENSDLNKIYSLEDSIPKYNSALDYIKIENKREISNTKTIITDMSTGKKRIFIETYWNGQEDKICECIDVDGSEEIIISSTVQNTPQIYQILRMRRMAGILEITHHSITTEDENGYEIEFRDGLTNKARRI